MTLEQIEMVVADLLTWCDPKRPDFGVHLAEGIFHLQNRLNGTEAEHHAEGRFWNASSGSYDEGGCW